MFGIGSAEIFVISLIVFLLFGPKAFVDMAKAVGSLIERFKRETKRVTDNFS